VTDAFFVPDGAGFVATELTRGPWSAAHQHGGPPSALLAYVLERAVPDMQLTRITVDFLRPVPIAPLTVRLEVLRSGRKVQRFTAMLAAGDEVVAHAVALLVRATTLALPPAAAGEPPPPPGSSTPFEFPFFKDRRNYGGAMEVRFARGKFGDGDVTAWMRMRVPLVPGETPSPMQRVLVAADSGSGVSAVVDPRRFSFLNADLTVQVHRPLEGEWVGLESVSLPQPHGVGLTDTRLHDTRGPIGRALQGLVLDARGPDSPMFGGAGR
jgi:hypothetical protein